MKLFAAALCMVSIATANPNRRVNLFTAMDFGRIQNGQDLDYFRNDTTFSPDGIALNRTYVDVTVAEQLDEKNFISIGVGGIFWKSFEKSESDPEGKVIHFGPGISNAFLRYSATDRLNLTFGYFPYKYNSSSRNLGEYLFRSEAYPVILYTGGWSWLNSAAYNAVGFKLTHEGETFKQDVGLFGEYFNAPIYDMTPMYVATWKPIAGLTWGGGIALHRFLSPDTKIRKELTEERIYYENFYVPANDTTGGRPLTRPAGRRHMLKDDIEALGGNEFLASDSLYKLAENQDTVSKTVNFDNRAIKVMTHATLDFNELFGLDAKRLGAFELYGEIAVLGFKNYGIFYTDLKQRMPYMLGLSIPTFGLLSNLSIEYEVLKNPNIESLGSTFDVLDLAPESNYRYKVFPRDDTKWSIHASRSLTSFLSIYLQVANDHMRLKDKYARPEFVPITNTPSHWYWLTRIQWAI